MKDANGRGNAQRKREAAAAHNFMNEVNEAMVPIGDCKCGGIRFIYTKSNPENIFNIYCSDCESRLDFRKLDEKINDVKLNYTNNEIIKVLREKYGDEAIEKGFAEVK